MNYIVLPLYHATAADGTVRENGDIDLVIWWQRTLARNRFCLDV